MVTFGLLAGLGTGLLIWVHGTLGTREYVSPLSGMSLRNLRFICSLLNSIEE